MYPIVPKGVPTRRSIPDFCSRAQSNGECPGSNITFRLLLLPPRFGNVNPFPAATPDAPAPTTCNLDLAAPFGFGATGRDHVDGLCILGFRLGTGGGGIFLVGTGGGGIPRLDLAPPPPARCAEFIAGNEGGVMSSSESVSSSEICGIAEPFEGWTGRARGVVPGDSSFSVDKRASVCSDVMVWISGTMHTAPLSLFSSDDDSDKLDWDCLRIVEKNGHMEREALLEVVDEEGDASISDAAVAPAPSPVVSAYVYRCR